MPGRLFTAGGLAGRVVRLAFFVGLATVAVVGTVAVWSTSRLSEQKSEARMLLVSHQVEEAIESRFAVAEIEVLSATAHALSTRSLTSSDLAGVLSEGSGTADVIIVASRTGHVVARTPRDAVVGRGPLRGIEQALEGGSGYITTVSENGDWELWVTRPAVSARGDSLVVIARLDTAFIEPVIKRAASITSEGTVVLLDGDRMLALAGSSPGIHLVGANWSADEQGSGRVEVADEQGDRLEGRFGIIGGQEGLAWRVVILEPASATVRDTVAATGPAFLVLVVAGVLALVAAWGISVRMIRPLRELERAARSAATGAYVKPIQSSGDDEISRVSEAFNAVALKLNALHDLSQLLASASRLDQVLDGILSAMGHIVGPGAVAIYLLEEGKRRLVPARTRGVDFAHIEPVTAAEGGWLLRALGSADPISFTGSADELARELPGLAGHHNEALAAPLVAGNVTLGLVVYVRGESSPVTAAELEMVRTFSAQAAVAVQVSRLFEEESESRKVAEAMRAVAETLVRPASLDIAIERVESIIADLFSANAVRVAVVDRAVLGMDTSPDHGQDAEILDATLPALKGASGGMLLDASSGRKVADLLTSWDAESLIAVPVALDTEHGAVLAIAVAADEQDGEGVTVAETLADQIALALDNAYFYERALARAANLETVFRISQAVGSSLQINVVLNRVLDVVQKILSADSVALLSYDRRRRTLATSMARGDLPASVLRLELTPGEDLPGRVFKSGEPVSVKDLQAGMDGIAGAAAQQQLRSLLAVPLMARGRPIGVLMVFSGQPGAFSDEDLNVLQTFAAQAALAIDTARLYSREHEVSMVLQQSILPEELPVFDEVESGSVYAPAGGDIDIGGDYYDLFRAPDGSIWLVIADVCGKGVHAATKTSMIKYVVRALVANGVGPSAVVGEVNRFAADTGDPSDIVTLWVGRYDPLSRRLTWSDGGHPPALVHRADGTDGIALGVTGPLLGAIRDVDYVEETVAFAPGDTILLYTDGVTEARQGNTFFGEERVREVLSRGGTAQEIAQGLLEEVRSFVRADLRDDVAVLVLRARSIDGAVEQEGSF